MSTTRWTPPAHPGGPIVVTPRMADVLTGLHEGLSRQQIAAELGVTLNTIRTHLRGIHKAAGTHDKAALTAATLTRRVIVQDRRGGESDTSVDEIAVERACRGERGIPLNRAEMFEAFTYLDGHGYSLGQIANRLGVDPRTVSRWRSGATRMPYPRAVKCAQRGVA